MKTAQDGSPSGQDEFGGSSLGRIGLVVGDVDVAAAAGMDSGWDAYYKCGGVDGRGDIRRDSGYEPATSAIAVHSSIVNFIRVVYHGSPCGILDSGLSQSRALGIR